MHKKNSELELTGKPQVVAIYRLYKPKHTQIVLGAAIYLLMPGFEGTMLS